MISVNAFKALEASLSARIQMNLHKLTKDTYDKIEGALEVGTWDLAEYYLNRMTLNDLFEGLDDYLAYITQLTMLFGASLVTANPKNSVVGLGYEQETQAQMVANFKASLNLRVADSLKAFGLQLIANRKSRAPVQKADKPRILLPFATFMDANGKAILDIASSLHTSRVSAYGFTAEALALGMTEYQLNEQLDSRTCPVCRELHGTRFQIKDVRGFLDTVVRTTDPEELKNLQPWPKQDKASLAAIKGMSSEELVANGWHTPPFHPRCRGLLGRVGKVPTLAQLDKAAPIPPAYTPTPEDFKAVGVVPDEKLLKEWARNVKLPPADIVAQLKGVSVMDLLSGAMGATDKAAYTGLSGITVTDAGIELKLTSKLYNSKEAIANQILIKENSVALDYLQLSVADQGTGVAKEYLQGLYTLTSDLHKVKMEITAGSDLSGFAWAKFGFRPNLTQWESVKAAVKKNLQKKAVVTYIDNAGAKSVLETIISSEDPAMIYLLSDLEYKLPNGKSLGETALAGTEWEGELDMNDPESVAKFIAYLGNQ